MTTSASFPATDELSRLKVAVLDSVLNDVPFSGTTVILRFPDLPFVLAQPNIYLVEEELKDTIHIKKSNRPVHLVSEKFVKENTPKSGRTIFLKFRTKKEGKSLLLLTLDANVYSASDGRTSILGSLHVKFKKEGDTWSLLGPSSFSSA